MKNHIVPKARKENLVVQELDGEVLIYDLDKNKAFCLNEASALVWQACDGNKDVSEIRNSLGKQLNSPVNDDFVWLALDQLKKENLIENKDEIAADFNGMSRRSVIKKVGLAVVVALPLVTSLVAPTAAAAQSLVACGAACTDSNQCPDICKNCISGGQGQTDRTCRTAGNAG
jgi:hypothetical protein